MRKSKLVAIISEQRGRDYMEDRHSFEQNFAHKGWIFGGVYDGHGMEKPAETAVKRIPEILKEISRGLTADEAFQEAYKTASEEMAPWAFYGGTCAPNFLIRDKTVYHANVGDCRIVVVGKKVVELTTDHRLENRVEMRRVKKAGGEIVYRHKHAYVYNGERCLMPTRTLGDQGFKSKGVISTPSTGQYHIKPSDRFLVAATDGLFDVVTNEEVLKISREAKTPARLADWLTHQVILNEGQDNLTIMVVKL